MVAVKEFKNIAAGTVPALTDTAIGVQSGTTDVQYTFAQIQSSIVPPIRTILTGNLSLYVNASTGSDSYNGLSATYTGGVNGPYATIQGGLNNAAAAYDIAGFVLTLSCATGTYDGFVFPTFVSTKVQNNFASIGVVIVQGDTGTVSNVVVSGTSPSFGNGVLIGILTPSPVLNSIDSLTIDATNITGTAVLATGTGAYMVIGNPDGSATSSGVAAVVSGGSTTPSLFDAAVLAGLDVSGNVSVSGSWNVLLSSIQESLVTVGANNSCTFTVANGTQLGAGFANAGDNQAGIIQVLAATFVDNGAVGAKFLVSGPQASIDVTEVGGDLNVLPGNAPGYCILGGTYVYIDSSSNAQTLMGGGPSINTQTASYQIALSDSGNVVEMSAAGANNLTIPANATTAFLIGTRIDITQTGAGTTTVVAAGGVTIRSSGGMLNIAGQYSGATIYKRGTDEWVLIGELA